jgi:preprotein translocase subunit SecB
MAQSESAAGEGLMAGEFGLERVYVKDLSFESPQAPDVFQRQWQPNVQLDINSRATAHPEDRFEVVLTVTVNVRSGDGAACAIVEVQQAGLFRIRQVPDEQRARMLATVCPTILFPYVRETVDSVMVKGGLPAMHLAPVNFDALFEEAIKRRAAEKADSTPKVSIHSPKGSIEH